VLIWRFIGWPCLIGVLTVLVGQGVNALLARVLLKWEKTRRAATDTKLQKISQFVEAIRHLRWYGWQDTWSDKIMEARQHELNIRIITGLWSILIGFTNQLSSNMFPVVVFYAYTALAGLPLRIDIAFPALQLFTMLETNLAQIPNLITVLLNASVAIGRINDFMNEPDKDERSSSKAPPPVASVSKNHKPSESECDSERSSEYSSWSQSRIELVDASFAWPGRSENVLHDITLKFPTGLTVICGEVAAGKSALLQALLGELDERGGEFSRPNEMVGYCAQTPWLQTMSIRENILFSSPYEETRYNQVLEACALIPDMANFKHGDLSEIGENGIGLSGGQKARVALARALYSRANLLLLDDPLSALDHQTAETIVQRCFGGSLLQGRTTILVTHRTELCSNLAEQVVEISAGGARVQEPRLSSSTSSRTLPNDETEATSSGSLPQTPVTETSQVGDLREDQILEINPKSDGELLIADTGREDDAQIQVAAEPEKFIEEEHRAHGGVKASIYWEYIKAGKLRFWFVLICILTLFRLITVARTWFLKSWGEAYNKPTEQVSSNPLDTLPSPDDNVRPWLMGFLWLAIAKAAMFLIAHSFMVVIVYTAGRKMFKDVLENVAHATFRFYDVTPIGRLMNRLTSDISTIDGNISSQFQMFAFFWITWVTSLVVIASVTPGFLVFSFVLTVAFVLIFMRFLPASQSLRRLEMVSLSPLMSNFGALLNGLTTVRAFCAQSRFQDRVIAVTDNFQKMDHFYWSLQAWLMYRFDALSASSTFILTLLALYTGVTPGLTAFVLIAASQFVSSTHLLCKLYGQLQMDFVSVERVVELLHVEQEPAGAVSPPAWWPTLDGDIVFENVTIRYAPHLDPSLSDLSFRIRAGSNTAIVGRTGSGKSTLALSLLAAVLPDTGRILVDNIDISTVHKNSLRRRVTFLAQDPVLFPGSMRQNLDPLEEYSDAACEAVLLNIAGRHEWKLTTHVDTGGQNLSQGQRQLVGLARALLRRSAIIILDEATASIDMETSMWIQQVLQEEMKGSTVITIAHRIEAVKNAEFCIVLDKGRVVEQGTAEDLLRGRE
jgi:ABC-type multidrug transport system fused ATPase/permease subunit